jgi:hypothetical protein
MKTEKPIPGLIDPHSLRSIIKPWYFFLGLAGAMCLFWAVDGWAGKLSPGQQGLGYMFAFVALMIAHSYRALYHISQNSSREIIEALTEVIQNETQA